MELPADLSRDLIDHLGRAWVCGRQLNVTLIGARSEAGGAHQAKPSSPGRREGHVAQGKGKRRAAKNSLKHGLQSQAGKAEQKALRRLLSASEATLNGLRSQIRQI